MLKIGVVSLGCSKNRVDSEIMMSYLVQSGYDLTPDPSDADVIVVNTCGFIESAKQESVDAILEMAEYKETGQCSTLVVTGCLSERYRGELEKELPEVDLMIGAFEYEGLPALLDERYPDHEKRNKTDALRYDRILSTPAHYAYLRIAEGCDNRCSFCAIPLIRGPYKSREMDSLLDEAKMLKERGVKELIVIAQDTTRYGLDIYGEKRLPELLDRLAQMGFEWIRLLYAYPNDIDDALLDMLCKHENILKYIDMPIQHIDDRLLKRMNRRGDQNKLSELMRKIREKDPRFVIRTTFIVGFPGETDAEFEKLCEFVKEHPMDRIGAFVYSPEDDTPAAEMPDQIDEELAETRLERLMTIQQGISKKLLENRIGHHYKVLVEYFDQETGIYWGRSYAEAPEIDGLIAFRVAKDSKSIEIGSFVNVLIESVQEYDLMGVLEDDFSE